MAPTLLRGNSSIHYDQLFPSHAGMPYITPNLTSSYTSSLKIAKLSSITATPPAGLYLSEETMEELEIEMSKYKKSRKANVYDYLGMFLLLFIALNISCFLVAKIAPTVNAYCECGYTFDSSISGVSVSYITTDLIETDFLHQKDVFMDTDWSVQSYSVTAEDSRGSFGTNFSISNVFSSPISDALNWTAPGKRGGLPGMQLVVSGGTPSNGSINTAQVNSVRTDLMYGSYRFLANLPKINGTCSAMFDVRLPDTTFRLFHDMLIISKYFNNSQETDIEVLSSQFFVNGTHLINLVQQTQDSASRGYSILGQDYIVTSLPFDPTNGFHEYRFDVVPGRIDFYGDHSLLGSMAAPAPVAGRHLIISHWSNGNPLWSGGPPVQDATMTLGYVKAYFNSSDPIRQGAALSRCQDQNSPGAYCPISDETPSGDTLFSEFFFAKPNMTNNQTIFGKKNETSARARLSMPIMTLLGLSFYVVLFL